MQRNFRYHCVWKKRGVNCQYTNLYQCSVFACMAVKIHIQVYRDGNKYKHMCVIIHVHNALFCVARGCGTFRKFNQPMQPEAGQLCHRVPFVHLHISVKKKTYFARPSKIPLADTHFSRTAWLSPAPPPPPLSLSSYLYHIMFTSQILDTPLIQISCLLIIWFYNQLVDHNKRVVNRPIRGYAIWRDVGRREGEKGLYWCSLYRTCLCRSRGRG